MAAVCSTTHPSRALAPPASPVPAPRVTTGAPAALAASAESTGGVPGTRGMPAAPISSLADALSPMRPMTSDEGPTKTSSFSAHARAKAGLSARNPQPG